MKAQDVTSWTEGKKELLSYKKFQGWGVFFFSFLHGGGGFVNKWIGVNLRKGIWGNSSQRSYEFFRKTEEERKAKHQHRLSKEVLRVLSCQESPGLDDQKWRMQTYLLLTLLWPMCNRVPGRRVYEERILIW